MFLHFARLSLGGAAVCPVAIWGFGCLDVGSPMLRRALLAIPCVFFFRFAD